MYIMLALIVGSLLIGCSGTISARAQPWLALTAATGATLIYYISQRAM